VVLVGAADDLSNRGTYFRRPFRWPEHVENFIGSLNLTDTAALLQECDALVSNDSGLMHLGAALGVPTFGIFGITSPGREALRVPTMISVSKGLPCEPACRLQPWGRRDCEFHLECLRTLGADEVMRRITGSLPDLAPVARCEPNAVAG
jgi:ADP-heptose:LPS heptosyltransferase